MSPSEDDSLSVIVPALNEELHLEDTIREVLQAARENFDRYEIVIVNDGSTDGTREAADELARAHDAVRAIHHERPRSLGGAFKTGLAHTAMHYVTLVNGKNDTTAGELSKIWRRRGEADMIIPYSESVDYRPLSRRIVSRTFTALINLLFGLRVRYYNHFVLHRRALVDSIELRTSSYAYQAEIIVKLIKRGHSYIEVAHCDKSHNEGPTKAFHPRNLWGVTKFLFWIIYDIYFTRRYVPAPIAPAAQPCGGEKTA